MLLFTTTQMTSPITRLAKMLVLGCLLLIVAEEEKPIFNCMWPMGVAALVFSYELPPNSRPHLGQH